MKSIARIASTLALLAVTFISTTPAFAQGKVAPPRLRPTSIVSTTTSALSQLPLALPVQQATDITYFNKVARATDVALVSSTASNLVSTVKNGKRMVAFSSWAAAQAALPGLIGKIDTVAYDPEHWANTPASEQNNLVATVKAASALAHKDGLSFFLVPDRSFDQSFGAQLAPYADIYCLQAQDYESNAGLFAQWTTSTIATLRGANPTLKIYVQVSTAKGTSQQMYAAISSVAAQINGIVVWSSAQSQSQVTTFLGLVRPAATTIKSNVARR